MFEDQREFELEMLGMKWLLFIAYSSADCIGSISKMLCMIVIRPKKAFRDTFESKFQTSTGNSTRKKWTSFMP